MFNEFPPPPPGNNVVYEIMWKNTIQLDKTTDGDTIRRMRFACWIYTIRIDSHSEYVIRIAFAWQRWSRERALMLRYTYIAHTV